MAGELRQQISIYRSKMSMKSPDKHFPIVETLRDSYGNEVSTLQSATSSADTRLTLHPGDTVHFVGSARDPEGHSVEWIVNVGSRRETLSSATNEIEFEWVVDQSDISESRSVNFLIRSDRPYHRQTNGYDGEAILLYQVLPL